MMMMMMMMTWSLTKRGRLGRMMIGTKKIGKLSRDSAGRILVVGQDQRE